MRPDCPPKSKNGVRVPEKVPIFIVYYKKIVRAVPGTNSPLLVFGGQYLGLSVLFNAGVSKSPGPPVEVPVV